LIAEISAHDSGFRIEQVGKGQLVILDIRANGRRPLPVDGDRNDGEPLFLVLLIQRLQTGALPQAIGSPGRPDVEKDHLPPKTRHVYDVSVEILQLKIADWNPAEGLDAEIRHERLGIQPRKFRGGLRWRHRRIPLVSQSHGSGQKQGSKNPDGEGFQSFFGSESVKFHQESQAARTESQTAVFGNFPDAFQITYLRRLGRMKSFTLLDIIEPNIT
jgi:hypothetical protein